MTRAEIDLLKRCVVKILFVTNRSYGVEDLARKIRELFTGQADPKFRAIARVTPDELVGYLLDLSRSLVPVGLGLDLRDGTVRLIAPGDSCNSLNDFLDAENTDSCRSSLSSAALEVLACIAFQQPISYAEIERAFAADKRSVVLRLQMLGLLDSRSGPDGRTMWFTTDAFLHRFNLRSVHELKGALVSNGASSVNLAASAS